MAAGVGEGPGVAVGTRVAIGVGVDVRDDVSEGATVGVIEGAGDCAAVCIDEFSTVCVGETIGDGVLATYTAVATGSELSTLLLQAVSPMMLEAKSVYAAKKDRLGSGINSTRSQCSSDTELAILVAQRGVLPS